MHLIYRSSIVKLLDSEEVTLEQVEAWDELVLEWCSKAREDPFHPGANILWFIHRTMYISVLLYIFQNVLVYELNLGKSVDDCISEFSGRLIV